MAAFDTDSRTSVSGLAVTARTLLMVGFTVVETVTLAVWLALVRDAPLASRASALGIGVLVVGLAVEHVLTDVTVNGLSLSFPIARIVGVSVSEAALWAVWLVVAERVGGVEGVLAAGVLLTVLLVPQHSVEDNVLRSEGLFADVIDGTTVGFSVVEGVGATIWLLLVFEGAQFAGLLESFGLGGVDPAAVGLVALALFLLIEHDIGVTIARGG